MVNFGSLNYNSNITDPPELKESSNPSRIEGPIQVKAGGSVKLNCNVTGIPPPIVTWTKDDLPIAFANNV